MSSCSAPTEKISQFVDYHLRPHVLSLDALGPLPPGALLVTLDVTSLYTNIPHDEGIQACEEVFNTRLTQEPPTGDLVQLIRFILTRNNFCFSGQHFLQVHGTAMGTRMAPSYANIFMGRLENHILTGRTLRPTVWWRFIDDIFAVWTHGEALLEEFLDSVNQLHPTIKFTDEWSIESVSFLDTKVIVRDGWITTDLYTKPTDTHQYLAANSCHPKHCKASITYSQALRLRRICSEDDDYHRRLSELKGYLTGWGHDPSSVQQQNDRAMDVTREDALAPRTRRRSTRVPLITTYHPDLPPLRQTIDSLLPVLHTSQRLRNSIPEPPIVAHRCPRNLRDLLVRAELKPTRIERAQWEQCMPEESLQDLPAHPV